ncbi:hypothetical protein CHS0354_016897 [Potamilus streckersoni]|uniref:C1q domain-containing protein n=1 Tax=Potamilus streckersoni TaxID=2493646 RepID=A0AAE0S8D5_9BIVA|nr:hypothetical protein CHS0354_016897 [Potamilus streckersoni]
MLQIKCLFLTEITSQPGSAQVAFSAYLSAAIHNLQIGQLISFDRVALNIGNGFDATTGTFTCPVAGIYFVTVSLMSYLNNELKAELVQDGNNIAGVYTAGGSSSIDNQGSNSVVTRCEAGQKLLVRAFDISGSKIWGHPDYRWSTFSGFLLYPVETEFVG